MLVACPSCRRNHNASDALLGRRVQCKDCGTVFVIEAQSPAVSTESAQGQDRRPSEKVLGSVPEDWPDQPSQRSASATAAAEAPARAAGQDPIQELQAVVDMQRMPAILPPAPLGEPVSHSYPRRPFGIVWIVFYWIISGVAWTAAGMMLIITTSFLSGMVGSMKVSKELSEVSREAAVGVAIMQLLALLVFHMGLLMLVACYGLWTFRKWGLFLARGLAVAILALYLIAFVVCAAVGSGFVLAAVDVVISILIAVQLFGAAKIKARIRQYMQARRPSEWRTFD